MLSRPLQIITLKKGPGGRHRKKANLNYYSQTPPPLPSLGAHINFQRIFRFSYLFCQVFLNPNSCFAAKMSNYANLKEKFTNLCLVIVIFLEKKQQPISNLDLQLHLQLERYRVTRRKLDGKVRTTKFNFIYSESIKIAFII